MTQLTFQTVQGSTIRGNIITASTLTLTSSITSNSASLSTITASTITTSTIVGTVILGQNATYPNRYVELGADATNSMYLDFHSSDASLPDYSTRIHSLGGATSGTGALNMIASTIGLLASSGVGIGTSAPSDSLVVNSGSVAINNAGTTHAGYLFNQNTVWGGVDIEGMSNAGAQTINIGVNMNRAKAWSSSYNGLWFRIDSRTSSNYNGFHFFNKSATSGTESEVMTILSGGNVGIGSATPAYPLSLMATNLSATTGTNISTTFEIAANQGSGGVSNGQFGGYLEGGCNYGQNTYLALGYITTPSSTPVKNEMMRITDTGRIGIGKTAPSGPLDVTGYLCVNNSVAATTAGQYQGLQIFYTGTGSTGYASFIATNPGSTYNPICFNPNGGNVGIGTTNPYTGLHIYHSSNPKVYLQGGSYTGFLSMVTSGFLDVGFDTGAVSGSTTGGVIRFYPNGSEAIRIANNGNMGIGTNNPGAVLQVNNTAASYTTPTLSVSDGAADLGGTYGMLNLTRQSATADNKAHISLIRNGSSVFNIGYLSGSNTVGFLAGSANMSSGSGIYIASNGNVGIATSVPGQTLDVYGTIARSGLKLPRVDYGTISSANSISIPILFSDSQYNVVEIRIRYLVSAQTNMTFSATSTASALMNIGEAQYIYIQYAQTAPTYASSNGVTTMNFASSVETAGIDNNALIRITRASGVVTVGLRNHYTIDNVYCWYGVGTTRATSMGHFDCSSVGGPALAYFNIACVNSSAQITGTYSTTHYN